MEDGLLRENIAGVLKRISNAAERAGRSPDTIRLIAVTKTVNRHVIKRAIAMGLKDFGENRVQEAQQKVMSDELRVRRDIITWHFIGHLQKNKARIAVNLFDMIQTVDSFELAELINKHAEDTGKTQHALIQVKLSKESAKTGILKENIRDIMVKLGSLRNVIIDGLMTMPPFFDDPEETRGYFNELRLLQKELESDGFSLPELSMGMTNDFEVAIQEGATMIRVGTALFGEREKR
ncbi:MAG: YggS family pyridoxal phosphate-dependent enzyme [Nitrospiraceae bacterium]|nr:MAG: YggS family pyridoxal phosphate-dependent enzyme [Nitrospiraceae bacterium]